MFRKFLVSIFFALSFNLFCQDKADALLIKSADKGVSGKSGINAEALVSKITSGKKSEKEKFDAIFYWVAKNIRYDESYFYSVYDADPSDISKILKTKRTICLGYAQLMDSLCKLAQITNVSVFGYAKDQLYDVNDSVYGHNHAWNAVKLEGLWYVYDVTWSEGMTKYVFSKRTKLVLNLLGKYPEKLKKKKVRIPRKIKRGSICKDKLEPIVHYKRRFFNYLLRRYLFSFPVKVYKVRARGINTDYYLSDPSVFATTHVPDDPLWSLTSHTKVAEFEQDSSFYYLNDSVLKSQQRLGVVCEKCDAYVEAGYQRRIQTIYENSEAFNFNNKFITTWCNDELGRHLFFKSYNGSPETRLAFADTSVLLYGNALNDIQQARKKITSYFKFQKQKNDTKARLLLKDNAGHVAFIKSKVKTTLQNRRAVNEVLNKSSAYATIFRNAIERTERYRIGYDFSKFKPYAQNRIIELRKTEEKKTKVLDSLSKFIRTNSLIYDSVITGVSLNIWPTVMRHDSIFEPVQQCIRYRRKMADNYKKVIVDARKNIYDMEYKYSREIDAMLYQPTAYSVRLFALITKAMKQRQAILNELLKTKLELTKAQEMSESELATFKQSAIQHCSDDFCWLRSNFPRNATLGGGLYALSSKQNYGLRLIAIENASERMRQSIISRFIKQSYKVSIEQIANDTKKQKKKYKEIVSYRNEIQNSQKFNRKRYDGIVYRIQKLLARN